ncbi:MAG: amidohydrolase family protein [Candidatus ainarchaeum sp.]|nr:amidohydrolase family protein [Candidatus ainarchaeum sp.]
MNIKQLKKMPKIDSHNHLFDSRLRSKSIKNPFLDLSFDTYTAKDLKKDLKEYSVKKAVVFPLPSESYECKKSNLLILESARRDNTLLPVAYLPKNCSLKDMFRYAHQGFVGFKIYSGISKSLAHDLAQVNLPIIVHPPFPPSSPNFSEMINQFKNTPQIILAHMGRAYTLTELKSLLKVIKNKPNIFVDTSAFTAKSIIIERIITSIGPSRVLFGSDFPFGNLEGFQMKVPKSILPKEHQHLAGIRILVSEKKYKWNIPELINLSKKLKLPKIVAHKKSSGQLFKVLIKLLKKGIINENDINNIFYNNASQLFEKNKHK